MSTKFNLSFVLKLTLQAYLGYFSLICLYFGVVTIVYGIAPILDTAPSAALDNQFRYSAGVYLVFTFLLWWIIPSIERHSVPLRIIAASMMLGGVGRLVSLLQYGSGNSDQLVAMFLELTAPLLVVWQHQVALRCQPTLTP